MKFFKFLAIAATAASVLALVSCTKEKDPGTVTVNPAQVSLVFTGDVQVVKVTASANWSAKADAQWVQLSPESGFASQTGEDLVISAETSTETSSRSCTVTVTLSSGATATIKVTQDGKPDGGIRTADDLMAVLSGLEGYPADGNYVFKNDIDMTGQVGATLAEFNGTLDGAGFKILNYVVKEKPLFTTNNGTVKNIIFDKTCSRTEDAIPGISTGSKSALVAVTNNGTIENVINNADLSRKADNGFGEATKFGVIASVNEVTGVIKGCTNNGTLNFVHDVTSKGNIYGGEISLGAIVAVNNGNIQSCTNSGAMNFDGAGIGKCTNTYNTNVGGIVGLNAAGGTISGSTNEAAIDFKMFISSSLLYVGGVAGQNAEGGSIATSSCNGNVTVDGISEESSILPGGTKDVHAGLVCGNSTETAGTGVVTVKNIGVPAPELHITTAAEFSDFLSTATSYEANAKIYLDNDIDISEQTITTATSFAGTFDGQNHSIYGIDDTHKEKTFFKENTGTIKNVVLGKSGDEANVVLGNFSTGSKCCILVTTNSGTVEGCVNYVSYGRAEGKNFGPESSTFGFLVGTNNGTVKNCTNYGKLQIVTTIGKTVNITKTSKANKNYFGTIVGNNNGDATVSGCVNNGSIVLPAGEGAPIKDNGDATAAGDLYIGAVCGRNAGTVESCTNNGAIDIDAGVTGTLENTVRFGLIYGGGAGTANNCIAKGSLTIKAYGDSNQNYKYGAICGADALGTGNVYGECTLSCTDNNGKGQRNPNE